MCVRKPRRHAILPAMYKLCRWIGAELFLLNPIHRPLSPNIHLPLLRHLRILLLEPLPQPFRALQELVHTPHHAALLLAKQTLRGEVGYTVVEASLDEVRVHLKENERSPIRRHVKGSGGVAHVHEVLHLLPLHAALQLALLRLVKPTSSSATILDTEGWSCDGTCPFLPSRLRFDRR